MRGPLRLLAAISRDPAGWFIAGGLMLLAAEARWGAPEPDTIVLDRAALSARGHELGAGPMDPDNLPPEVRAIADQEMLVREALRLGLHRSDPVLRRRMAQKMDLLLEGVPPEPTDDQLAAWLAQDPERYRVPARVSFDHVFVRDGTDAPTRAADLLTRLRGGAAPIGLGDPWPHATPREVAVPRLARLWGPQIADALARAPVDRWIEVSTSAGRHLLHLTSRTDARVPAPDEIRPALRRDWQDDWRRRHRLQRLQELRARYPVRLPEEAP